MFELQSLMLQIHNYFVSQIDKQTRKRCTQKNMLFRMWKNNIYPQISNVNNIQFSVVFSTPTCVEGKLFNMAHDLLYVTCSLTTFTIASGEKIEFVWCCDIVQMGLLQSSHIRNSFWVIQFIHYWDKLKWKQINERFK